MLKRLYLLMLRIRRVEERIAALYPAQEMRCPTHLCIGQEAVAAGVGLALEKTDLLFGTYRSHGLYLAKGGDLNAMMAELYGRKTGVAKGRSGSMQLASPQHGFLMTSAIVGGTIPIAVGAALAMRVRKENHVSAVVFGDGATEEGVFHESLNFAALKKLPVIFICENNLYSVYTPLAKRQPADNIADRGAAYTIPSRRLDGNDPMAVYEAVSEAIARARSGGGPTLLECRTYRWLEHVGFQTDEHLGYRTKEEVASWRERCPLRMTEARLRKMDQGWNEEEIRRECAAIDADIEKAVAFARQSPFPDEADMASEACA